MTGTKTHVIAALAVLCISLTGVSAQTIDAEALLSGEPRQIALARGLSEVSGLAAVSEKSVLAHNDEHGIVYEIDLGSGKLLAVFALGEPTVRGDFEGIAASEDRVFLITSTGLLYDAERGEHGHRVKFNVYDTGVSDFCEVEGLDTVDETGDEFIILCKTLTDSRLSGRLVIFRWSLDSRKTVREPWISTEQANFLTAREREKFRPSAIEWDAENQRLIIVSARNNMFVVLDDKGNLLFKKRLSKALHRQAEGVALTEAGLVIADESGGRGRGVISIY